MKNLKRTHVIFVNNMDLSNLSWIIRPGSNHHNKKSPKQTEIMGAWLNKRKPGYIKDTITSSNLHEGRPETQGKWGGD